MNLSVPFLVMTNEDSAHCDRWTITEACGEHSSTKEARKHVKEGGRRAVCCSRTEQHSFSSLRFTETERDR